MFVISTLTYHDSNDINPIYIFISPVISVPHAVSVTDLAPVQFVHHAVVDPLLARVELGVEETVSVGAGLAGVPQVRGQHQQEVVCQDLRSCPGVLQESLHSVVVQCMTSTFPQERSVLWYSV